MPMPMPVPLPVLMGLVCPCTVEGILALFSQPPQDLPAPPEPALGCLALSVLESRYPAGVSSDAVIAIDDNSVEVVDLGCEGTSQGDHHSAPPRLPTHTA